MTFLQLVDLLPHQVRYKAWVWLGRRRRLRGNLEAARNAFERAVLLFPNHPEAEECLESVRKQLGRTYVDPVSAEPILPLRRRDFEEKQCLRGVNTGNQWRVEKRLGEGAMGVVFRVRNEAEGSDRGVFALKTYKALSQWQDRVIRRFEREALTWVQLGQHPNIVQALWVERLEGVPCIIIEYVPKGTLKELMQKGPIAVTRALPLALNLCDGLHYAHARLGLVHRDVKPANCLIGDDGALKVADFGISLAFQNVIQSSNRPPGIQGTGSAGTPGYQAPEQLDPRVTLDARADIYAFGVTLAEMLAGKLLGPQEIAIRITTSRFEGSLWQLVRQCVEKDREQRPRDFDVLRSALEACYLEQFGRIAPPPPEPPGPTAEEHQDKAASFIALGQPMLAIRSYERALQVSPNKSALWAGLSAAHFGAGEYPQAIAAADSGLSLGRQTSSLLNNKGQALLASGYAAEALTCFDDAAKIDPDNPILLRNRAKVLWKMHRHSDALEACEAALRTHSRDVPALVLKSDILLVDDRVDEAKRALEQAAQVDPRDPEVLFGFSWVLDRMGRTDEALDRLELALSADRENLAMLRQKGWLLLKLNRTTEALECLDRVLARDPRDVEALRGKALGLLVLGRRESALEAIYSAAQIDPGNELIKEILRLAKADSE